MKYENTNPNSGLLRADMVKTGDRLIILDEAIGTFNADRQVTYWNAKVMLPGGGHKLASLFDSTCEMMSDKWGGDTADWVGHTLVVDIRNSKKTGEPYIWLTPTDDERIDVSTLEKKAPVQTAKPAATPVSSKPKVGGTDIDYPEEEINPDDIPF